MRFLFKTSYLQDIRLAKHGGHVFWYGLLMLAMLAAPWVVSEYWLAQLTFVLIYSVVGLGLMLLSGFTGLFSLGHAAFIGVVEALSGFYLPEGFKDIAPYVVVLIMLVVRPNGLFGEKLRKKV